MQTKITPEKKKKKQLAPAKKKDATLFEGRNPSSNSLAFWNASCYFAGFDVSPGIVEEDCHVPDGVELETCDFKEQMASAGWFWWFGLCSFAIPFLHVEFAYRNI